MTCQQFGMGQPTVENITASTKAPKKTFPQVGLHRMTPQMTTKTFGGDVNHEPYDDSTEEEDVEEDWEDEAWGGQDDDEKRRRGKLAGTR